MSHLRRRPRRGGGAPERNTIQSPELIQRLTQRFGLRQAHVAPALTDTVQPVIIMDDVSQDKSARFRTAMGWPGPTGNAGDGVNFAIISLVNPVNSGVRIRVKRITQCNDSTLDTIQRRISIFFTNNITGAGSITGGAVTAFLPFYLDSAFYAPAPANLAIGVPLPEGGISEFPKGQLFSAIRTLAVTNFVQIAMQTIKPSARCMADFDWSWHPFFLTPGFAVSIIDEENAAGTFANELMTNFYWEEEPLGIGSLAR